MRLLLGAALVAVLVAALAFGHLHAGFVSHLLARSRAWGRHSIGLFIVMQTLLALTGLFPASLAGVAAGALYGIGVGFAVAAASTLASAMIGFVLSRSIFRTAVAAALQRRGTLARLDAAMTRDGWRSVCLLRLSPIMPFAATSYALGLTGISWADYLIGTLASLPALLGYVLLGQLGGAGVGAVGGSPMRLALLGVGIAATLVATLRIGRMIGRSLGEPA